MIRRQLGSTLLACAAVPLAAWAQPAPRRARIAVLGGSLGMADPATMRNMVEPLRKGLREWGWVEGQNLIIEWRFAEGKPQRLPALLAEALASTPELLMAIGPGPAMLAKEATRTLPIVAVPVDDPVQMGLADSYARPGRNITGLSGAYHGLLSRRLQLLKDLVPSVRRVGILMNPHTLPRATLDQGVDEIRRQSGLEIVVFEARGPEDFETTLAAMARDRLDGVLILADATFYAHRMRLGEWCTKLRLPSVWGGSGYLDAGGLASFQGDFAELFRRSATMIDKILKGTAPGEIAWEQSTKFELVVSLKAARALGLKVPPSVLVSADEVIE
jgi:putative tryptophan/tyrosine transport system substrate-binding protein